MDDETTPFAEVPDPSAGPRPTPVTYEQQIAGVGAFAAGVSRRSRLACVAVRVAVLALVLFWLLVLSWDLVFS